jgi:hypothetical protein
MIANRMPAFAEALLVVLALSQTAWTQQIVIDANDLVVREGNTTLLRYRYGGVPFKPYVKELYTPSGINVLLDAPADHLHHHGLMFACAVNNVDFWGEATGSAEGHFEPVPGKQRQNAFNRTGVGGPEWYHAARFGQQLFWESGPRKETLLYEDRMIAVGQMGTPKATVLTWASCLWGPKEAESVVLSGSHYHGLGLRFVRSMDATGEFRNPNNDPGIVFRGEERLVRSRWCAYTAQVNGKTVTVAMFDHPENPRHPATWFTMAKPFAYLSATWRLHEEPLKLPRDGDIEFYYGVALWDGRPETAQIDNLYMQWVGMVQRRGGEFYSLLER